MIAHNSTSSPTTYRFYSTERLVIFFPSQLLQVDDKTNYDNMFQNNKQQVKKIRMLYYCL